MAELVLNELIQSLLICHLVRSHLTLLFRLLLRLLNGLRLGLDSSRLLSLLDFLLFLCPLLVLLLLPLLFKMLPLLLIHLFDGLDLLTEELDHGLVEERVAE